MDDKSDGNGLSNDKSDDKSDDHPSSLTKILTQTRTQKRIRKARRIPKESNHGNIEYKLHICINKEKDRTNHLVTQMLYRLHEGCGRAIYNIGYEDNGVPTGLQFDYLLESIKTIYEVCKIAEANIKSVKILQAKLDKYCANIFINKSKVEHLVTIDID